MFAKLPQAFESDSFERYEEMAKMDDQVDLLESEIIGYLGKVRQRTLSETESRDFVTLMIATDILESLGDVIETDLVALGVEKIDGGLAMSDTTRHMPDNAHALLTKAIHLAVKAVRENDQVVAQEVVAMKDVSTGVAGAGEIGSRAGALNHVATRGHP